MNKAFKQLLTPIARASHNRDFLGLAQRAQIVKFTKSRSFGWGGGSPPPDFDPKKDYYKVLEVGEKASQSEVKNAFYRLAQFYHPDRNNGMYAEKFKDITVAYQVLNDEKKRARYDALRKGQDDPEGPKNPFKEWGQQWTKQQSGQKTGGNYQQSGFDTNKAKQDFEEFFKKQSEFVKKQGEEFQKKMKEQQEKAQKSGYKSSFGQKGGSSFGGGRFGIPQDKQRLVHGLFLIFGGLFLLKILFGGGGRGQHYPPGYGGPEIYPQPPLPGQYNLPPPQYGNRGMPPQYGMPQNQQPQYAGPPGQGHPMMAPHYQSYTPQQQNQDRQQMPPVYPHYQSDPNAPQRRYP